MRLMVKGEELSPKDTIINLNDAYEADPKAKENFVDLYVAALIKLGQESATKWRLEEIGIKGKDNNIVYTEYYNLYDRETNILIFETKKGLYFTTFYFDDFNPITINPQKLKDQIMENIKFYKFSSKKSFILDGMLDVEHQYSIAKWQIMDILDESFDDFTMINFTSNKDSYIIIESAMLKALRKYNSMETVKFMENNLENFSKTFDVEILGILESFYTQELKDRNLKRYKKIEDFIL